MREFAALSIALLLCNSAAFAEPPDIKMEAESAGEIAPYPIDGATDEDSVGGSVTEIQTPREYEDNYDSSVRDTLESEEDSADKVAEDAYVEAEVDAASGVDDRTVPTKIIEDSAPARKQYPVCSKSIRDKCINPRAIKPANMNH